MECAGSSDGSGAGVGGSVSAGAGAGAGEGFGTGSGAGEGAGAGGISIDGASADAGATVVDTAPVERPSSRAVGAGAKISQFLKKRANFVSSPALLAHALAVAAYVALTMTLHCSFGRWKRVVACACVCVCMYV